jgi:hypothetical protein
VSNRAAIIGFLLFEPDGLIEIYRRIAAYFERWPFRYRELRAGGHERTSQPSAPRAHEETQPRW